MKIGLGSDLHIEKIHIKKFIKNPIAQEQIMTLARPSRKLDVLLLAGDICELRKDALFRQFIESITDYAEHIVIIPGNHEFWLGYQSKLDSYYTELLAGLPNVHYLENEELLLPGLRIFGACLWTDFGGDKLVAMDVSSKRSPVIRDDNFRKIKMKERGIYRKFSALDCLEINRQSKLLLTDWLETTRSSPEKRLLLTHYPPLKQSAEMHAVNSTDNDDLEKRDVLTKIECTDLTDVLRNQPNLTLAHGHTHSVRSYISDIGLPVYCNPRGSKLDSYEIEVFEL
ncbi:metallophosphoesterase [Vibrio mediterranei]|uniref:metallophosphoesterase n=1 Tax=Vibrio mediterranei TaxID=689 RepID=UPI0040697375